MYAGQKGATQGEARPDGTYFAKFNSPEAGFKALENQMSLYGKRGLTIEQAITTYAPPTDNNDTRSYIDFVVSSLTPRIPTISKDTKLSEVIQKVGTDTMAKIISQREDAKYAFNFLRPHSTWQAIPSTPKSGVPLKLPTAQAIQGNKPVNKTANSTPYKPVVTPVTDVMAELKDKSNPNRTEVVKKLLESKNVPAK